MVEQVQMEPIALRIPSLAIEDGRRSHPWLSPVYECDFFIDSQIVQFKYFNHIVWPLTYV